MNKRKAKNIEKKGPKERNGESKKMKTKKNDPWSDHLKIQFGPVYPFFRNHEPWPTLRT